MSCIRTVAIVMFSAYLTAGLAGAQTKAAATPSRWPDPPTRDPHTPGYVQATELPDGANAPAPAHNPAYADRASADPAIWKA